MGGFALSKRVIYGTFCSACCVRGLVDGWVGRDSEIFTHELCARDIITGMFGGSLSALEEAGLRWDGEPK